MLLLNAAEMPNPMRVCAHSKTKRRDMPININRPKAMVNGKSNSSGVFIPNIFMNNWAASWPNTFSGLDNTAIKGKTAEILMASMKDATVIRPSNRMK